MEKRQIRNFLTVILDKHEITEEDARLSCKELVLQEDAFAFCKRIKHGFSICSGRKNYGKGETVADAWENAAWNILGLVALTDGSQRQP